MALRGPLEVGEKVQLSDRKGNMITTQLEHGAVIQTPHGHIRHDDVIGLSEGSVIVTATTKREATDDDRRKPWKAARAIGGWQYAVMRPRLADYVLSMPRGAQIMYPKDIAQVLSLGDIRTGMRVLESGAGSGSLSIHLLDAVGERGSLTTIELRPEFARIAQANATVYFGGEPQWWQLLQGDFDSVAAGLEEHSFDRVVLDMLDPWNRLDQVERVIAPGGVLTCYITTTTQMSRLADALRDSERWTEPTIDETLERSWKAQGLSVRPDHQMIAHTGFLVIARAMTEGSPALRRRERGSKDTYTDVDGEGARESFEALELRDISDRKLRKVIRDLDHQRSVIEHDAPDDPKK
ncbi:tRNA (adenine-N1)-methyltransferase [Bifidobacterium psychraerophilum]|uniref:tRNA (adenine(58)-N(1))-methyltransferase TrmI n=1 Tax=Bifidobacterium psychraerophilum TaxID=218140 RepID=A0A087CD74_9BIFI|nr:class I SAM-dependent methyltransferase [Bifidobacterium psychraerophilum]KFI81224.1 tRNA (adenine-N(1)-)-methyltransferase [Bifidobacterium psychraerophilum]PKA95567.1 tRNA (adenine57-N1/adenine58-N1)-methyltransferase [Bifidobacterium psychraerophilum DSM 22366]